MKRSELDDYIEQYGLLKDIEPRAGIYAITANDRYVLYVGESKNVLERCKQHIYYIHNAIFIEDEKYKLLDALELGGFQIDCKVLEYCDMNERFRKEEEYITLMRNPILNRKLPNGRQEIPTNIAEVIYYFMEADKRFANQFGIDYENPYARYSDYHDRLLEANG